MKQTDYRATVLAQCKPSQAYLALTRNIGNWWTQPDQPICRVGDRAKFTFPPNKSYWTFQAAELKPDSFIRLDCVDAYHIHEGQSNTIEQEWKGTSITWRIEPINAKTQIVMQHDGLRPDLECFEICKKGWDFFFCTSLKAYLETGTGSPHST